MDTPDTPKARRPLPTPGAQPASAQRPSTPVPGAGPLPIPPSSFYGTPKPPPLPSRPKNLGSTHTAYAPPPRYESSSTSHSPGFREPELVVDDSNMDEDILPDLVPNTENWADNTYPVDVNNDWGSNGGTWKGSWDNNDISNWSSNTGATSTGMEFEPLDYMGTTIRTDHDYNIDGRDIHEETHWWSPEERERNKRPGPGMLPPVLAEALHDPHHSLFSINFTSFPPIPTVPKEPTSSSPPSSSLAEIQAPSETETRKSVPHPNAYYCPKDNGWVILSWKSSSVAPSLAQSYLNGSESPLPDQNRRRRTPSCIDSGEHPYGKPNKTHHFHKYEKSIDSHKLTPPFRQDHWQSFESVKQKRRAGGIMPNDININVINVDDIELLNENDGESNNEEGKLFDLYICCQCSFYCVASGIIPGVIPRKHIEELIRDKKDNPPLGKTPEQAVILAVETFLIALENKLWKGNNRMIKVMSTGFQNKVGWNPNVKRIFELLGFIEESVERDCTLKPPVTDLSTPLGKQSRRKLLRAWLEFNAWLTDYKRVNASQTKDMKENKLHVQLDSAREMYQNFIGAHPDQIPRGILSDSMLEAVRPLREAWHGLGLTPTTFSGDLLAFAYLAQCRCDPARTPQYFTYLTHIVRQLEEYGSCPSELQELVALEQSRDRFTLDEVDTAATILGFGADNSLHVEYDEDIPDEFIESAWKDCIKRSWRDSEHGSETQRHANDAFRILAEMRNSVTLRRSWEIGKNYYMNPERAYSTLEIPKDVDDYMLITVYNLRLEETPLQMEKMKEAIAVIAEVRNSDRLRQFISTGQDPGDVIAPTRPDLPRGLNQLGNTCYLNSLLQYFYTIKALREAVLPMSKLDLKALEDERLSDEELKKHRVGGRLVTRREIIRSRKFINQLADLFYHLEYAEAAAVTPTIELAKLALVTSRDEEEDEVDKGGTESSNDTDATLVDDGPSRPGHTSHLLQSPEIPSGSVLGKRPRDLDRQLMDVDSPSQLPMDQDSASRHRASPELMIFNSSQPEASSSKLVDKDGDVKMPNPSPPKPPRKRVEQSDSTMMFGKQHDVAECMDNCMFQIETALLKFDGMSESSDKTSIVKSLFYGKIRQRLTGPEAQNSRASIHEKEDLFSHLPVNVTNEGVDIYDGLGNYFDDMVEFEGRKVRMEVTLVDLPPVLQIQLQRVQFNRETLQPYKSQAYVKFGENLYMDRFLDTADAIKKAKSKAIHSELTACRDRLRLLVEGKDSPFATSLERTSNFLTKLQSESIPGIDPEVLLQLDEEKIRIHDEIDHLRARIDVLKNDLESTWSDCTEAAYELTSVFIHRGSSPSWGHYFFYSRHLPGAPDSWFKYNDSDVTVVPKEEILADTTGSTANPYLLVFARKGADVVDTVKRFDATMLDSDLELSR
ncbi:cysteine proteinase [Pholiota conissans]|uniref:ubiquitinyl hydrolase 1 n=1 Tax=Pholiota conissans TaxID=109636 RepID=A0A9P6CZF2_9AGAR|nr:cysteine proteinase [Pholiota conissans]